MITRTVGLLSKNVASDGSAKLTFGTGFGDITIAVNAAEALEFPNSVEFVTDAETGVVTQTYPEVHSSFVLSIGNAGGSSAEATLVSKNKAPKAEQDAPVVEASGPVFGVKKV